jgi:hypothetical protein
MFDAVKEGIHGFGCFSRLAVLGPENQGKLMISLIEAVSRIKLVPSIFQTRYFLGSVYFAFMATDIRTIGDGVAVVMTALDALRNH